MRHPAQFLHAIFEESEGLFERYAVEPSLVQDALPFRDAAHCRVEMDVDGDPCRTIGACHL
ncbi:hypothetical protein ADK47_03710 [Streptomyces rimosus subsp. rimosus]|nr:hypothetical protein DF17_30980 [Streptomyces rimosus]KOG69889.1 hypothetical protein ADK78_31215 [Kitasatospora aureofaciens]KOT30302.1 hypothetical protein ADK42_30160 [Streptomyces rimosus subsp. rimosus]KOT30492.1 hypothetical protein ADK84_32065 [Streptomyces sp. NRRL WC-3701]KEF06826.1 hypothetical protein DF18_37485 [Streptomyces rimosus]